MGYEAISSSLEEQAQQQNRHRRSLQGNCIKVDHALKASVAIQCIALQSPEAIIFVAVKRRVVACGGRWWPWSVLMKPSSHGILF